MFNIVFPIIIFVSLATIVFIVGKHLPEFAVIKKEEKGQFRKENYFKIIFKKIIGIIKSLLMWLAEKIIKKSKNFLSLIQSWIIDKKKKKLKEDDIERVQDMTKKPESNFLKKITQEKEVKTKEDDFFNEKATVEVKSKKNFFINLKNNLKEKILKRKRQKINQVFQEDEDLLDDNSCFSDGIVKIHEKVKKEKVQEKSLINEVIEVEKDSLERMSLDEEIGVDRHILEKKLINKIALNPRAKEVYRQLGELYLKMENYSDAEGCYRQILKIAIRDVDAKRKIERIKLLKRSQQK